MQTANDRLTHDLQHALDDMHVALARTEILAAALNAFCKPVPDYAGFHHLERSGRAIAGYQIEPHPSDES